MSVVAEGNQKLPWWKFERVSLAQGYAVLGIARGPLVMSNIFLSTAFIFLASEEAGCLTPSGDDVADDCDQKVRGFKPASFIANIAVIAGVLSALLMPLCGAMIDYTDHRKLVGVAVAAIMILIQMAQIGTVLETWFYMAIAQAIAGFLYQVEVLATYAYLPETARAVGEATMTNFQASFTILQFAAQATFLIVVIALSAVQQLNTVQIGQVGQAINVLWSGSCFYLGWRFLPKASARHSLPEGSSLLTVGFFNVFKTIKKIWTKYKRGLRWYLLAVVFAEAAANAFTVVAVVYLDEQIGMSAEGIGIFFFISLMGSIPGSRMGAWVTSRLDPKRSWQICMFFMTLVGSGGAILLDYVPTNLAYVWGACLGCMLGWFYPTEGVFFSMCLPEGQEAEMAGFFVYCTQILGWLPPLVFALLVESDVSQTWAVVSVTVFFLIAIGIIQLSAPWSEILEESGRTSEATGEKIPELLENIGGKVDSEDTP